VKIKTHDVPANDYEDSANIKLDCSIPILSDLEVLKGKYPIIKA